jgi:hypothetical protein
MYTLTDSSPAGMSLLDFPAPAGKVIAGAFDDALETNPVPLFMLSRELYGLRSGGPMIPKDQADEEAKRNGVSVKVPEDGISRPALGILIERRKDQAARDLLFARREGTAVSLGMFGAGIAGAFLDPLNAAAGYIPVLSGTRYAAMLERAATAGSRAAIRGGIGAVEGLVGATLVEGPTLALRRDLQDEYGLYDSLANIAFGTFASSGLRMVGGLARDSWKGIAAARQEDFLRSIDPSEWKAARLAYEQQIERDMISDLEMGFERGGGPSDELAARWAVLRQADEIIGRQRQRMNEAEIERFIQQEERFRSEAKADFDERLLLDSRGIAERKFREMDLAEVKERLSRGEGLIIVPGNEREIAAAISDETHAHALKAAVAQAVEGRRIDVEPILKQDPVFGPQRMSGEEVKARARSNMSPESKVSADPEASKRAEQTIKDAEAPAAKPGGAKPPPPRGARSEAAGVEASLVEAEALLQQTQKRLKEAANDAGVEPPELEATLIRQSQTYDKAWKAIAACAQGKGV